MAGGGISRQSGNLPDAALVTIVVDAARSVSGLLLAPPGARACYLFAHGAGAGMNHSFMAAVAAELGGGGEDAGPQLGGELVGAGEGVGHRHPADADAIGDRLQGHPGHDLDPAPRGQP